MLPVLAPLRGRPARLRSPRVCFEIAAGGGRRRHDTRAEEVAHDPVTRGPVVASVDPEIRQGQAQVRPFGRPPAGSGRTQPK